VVVEVAAGDDVEAEDAGFVDGFVPMGLVEEEQKAVDREKGMGLKDAADA
jgi:hypothetical protein